jgi:hypothetical protein
MSNDDVDGLQLQYREAVRLHLWYSGSKYSVHGGKASKDLANTYRDVAHKLLSRRAALLRKGGR